MAFNPQNDEHGSLLKKLFPGESIFPSVEDGLEPPPEPSKTEWDYLGSLKGSDRVERESVTHRKLSDLREKLPSQTTRWDLVAWLVAKKYRVFLWNDYMVVLNDNISEIEVLRGPITQVHRGSGGF